MEMWTIQQCADHWEIKPATWRAYVSRGEAPAPAMRVGVTPVWDPASVKAWPRPRKQAKKSA